MVNLSFDDEHAVAVDGIRSGFRSLIAAETIHGFAFHAVDLQIFVPEYCAKWDQEPATAVATRRALIQRSYTNIPKPKPNRITPLSSPPIDHPSLFLCGAHIPFPGIVSKIHLPMASAHEAPSFDTPDPGTPIPAEPRPPEPPEPLVEIRRRAEPAANPPDVPAH